MFLRLKTSLPLIVLSLVAIGAVWAAEEKTVTATVESKYPGLSSGSLSQAVPSVVRGALLEADGVKITSKDITGELAKIKSPVKEQYTTYQFALLEDIATGQLLEKEARDWAAKSSTPNLQGEQLMRGYVNSLVGEIAVSDEEASLFYKENAAMFGTATYEQVGSAIKGHLRQEKGNALLNNHLATLSARHSIRISDVWMKQQHAKWIKTPVEHARRSGKPTMAKFGANTCKPCLAMAPIIKEIEKTYEGRLNVIDINVDKDVVVGSHYGTGSIPLVVFYDKDGKEASRTVGYRDKEAIEAELAKLGVK